MVVENENQTDRLPAAVGVICSSDANEPETRVLSPQEQTEINNVIKQFITIRTTQITNINQVINIINNITTNQTGGGNQTGAFEVEITKDIQDGTEAPSDWCFETTTRGGMSPYTYSWNW